MSNSKLRNATSEGEAECEMDMSPMIDMVFLLLIFFIVNATAIIVKTDPEVKPPIAKNGKPQENADGRIVINIHDDGVFTAEDFGLLPDDAAIKKYVRDERKINEGKAVPSKLHIRGHKQAVFKYARQAIRAAAGEGVNNVVFAVYTKELPGGK